MSTLKEYNKRLLETSEDSDFKIEARNDKNEEVVRRVHKLLLKRSTYFQALFAMNGKEVAEGVVKLEDISAQTLDCILKYLYYEEIEIESDEQILDLIPAAEYLQLDSMKQLCIKMFKKKFKLMNAGQKLLMLDRICEYPPLFKETTLNNFWYDVILEEENWNSTETLSPSFFREFITRSGQSMPQRSYKHLVRWMNASIEERKPLAKELMSYINFNGFPLRALIDMSSDSVFDSESIIELLRNKKNEEVALAALTPEQRKFTFVFTHNTVHEFEFCGLQWLFACQIFKAKTNGAIIFILKSTKTKHFKIRIALLNTAEDVVLEWTSTAPVYLGSVPNVSILDEAKNDGVFTFEISLLPISSEQQRQQGTALTAPVQAPPTMRPPPIFPPKQPPQMQQNQARLAGQPKAPPGPTPNQQTQTGRNNSNWILNRPPPTSASLFSHVGHRPTAHIAKRPRITPPLSNLAQAQQPQRVDK